MTYETCEKSVTWADWIPTPSRWDIPQRHFLVSLDLLVVDGTIAQDGISGSC
ncbi:MAG TPA: hypothetical protein VN657_11915 [Nitrospiraceae bacterium]|jgi:hypothetical protein|nr:hypothetical protein [Nitrospiraceae bacterium]